MQLVNTNQSNDTALVRGVRTSIQAALATLLTFSVGCIFAVWNVPGVPDALLSYIYNNLPQCLMAIGLPTGIVSFIWNVLRPNVRNW